MAHVVRAGHISKNLCVAYNSYRWLHVDIFMDMCVHTDWYIHTDFPAAAERAQEKQHPISNKYAQCLVAMSIYKHDINT